MTGRDLVGLGICGEASCAGWGGIMAQMTEGKTIFIK